MKIVLTILTLAFIFASCSDYSKLEEGTTCYIRKPQPTDGIYEKGASGLKVADIKNCNDTIRLNSNSFLDARNFNRIEIGPIRDDKMVELRIFINHEGADIFSILTRRNIGGNLYYVVDETLVYSVNILAQIMDGSTFMVLSKRQFHKLFKTH